MSSLKIFLEGDKLLMDNKSKQDKGIKDDEKNLELLDAKKELEVNYINSQKDYADLYFKLIPVNPNFLTLKNNNPRVKLFITMANGYFHEQLSHSLIALCGVHIDIEKSDNLDKISQALEVMKEAIAHDRKKKVSNLELESKVVIDDKKEEEFLS